MSVIMMITHFFSLMSFLGEILEIHLQWVNLTPTLNKETEVKD